MEAERTRRSLTIVVCTLCSVALLGLATLHTSHLSTELVGVPIVYKPQPQTAVSAGPGSSSLSSTVEYHENGAPKYPELGANEKPCSLKKLWDNCKVTRCCDEELVCYEQNNFYAQCMRPGHCSTEGGLWACNVLYP